MTRLTPALRGVVFTAISGAICSAVCSVALSVASSVTLGVALATLPSRIVGAQGQEAAERERTLDVMVQTERAFAARALVVGWKQAFLEYFSPAAIGFDTSGPGPAHAQLAQVPDPPPTLRLVWEPRYGDVAASGDLGYLTGPVETRRTDRPDLAPRYSNYASIWRREPDGTFRVLMDVGVTTPGPVAFPEGFTRAPRAAAWTPGTRDSLLEADAALDAEAAAQGQASAVDRHLAGGARVHRFGIQPLTTAADIRAWLATQPVFADAAPLGAAVSAAGDLGLVWGRYRTMADAGGSASGHYARVWVRTGDRWTVVLDVHQPLPA
ncbi:MAG: nuclear transport factor 2 family protein [Vicinamibacterales bacterium]